MHRESMEQQALFKWVKLQSCTIPELELLYHIPNGGKRNLLEAKRLKAEGVRAGIPDLCLPVARGDQHGLYIELKAGKNKPTDTQLWWIDRLMRQGYEVHVCYGWEEAKDKIIAYLKG